jgi:signal peptidase II
MGNVIGRRVGRLGVFVVIALVALAFDQSSKAWARGLPVAPAGCSIPADIVAGRCGGVRQTVIDGYWDWELAMNPGAAFSTWIGGTGARVALSALAVLAVFGIGIAAWRSAPQHRMRRVAFALLAGGALGNLVDRVRDGAVTDFVRWHVHDHLWPIFNVADVALVVGVALLFVEQLGRVGRRREVATR